MESGELASSAMSKLWLFRNQYAGKNAFNGFTRLLAFWTILNCSWRTFAYGILKSPNYSTTG